MRLTYWSQRRIVAGILLMLLAFLSLADCSGCEDDGDWGQNTIRGSGAYVVTP